MERIQSLVFTSDFTHRESNSAVYTRRSSIEHLAKRGGKVAIAVFDNTTIIGLAVLSNPETDDRWAVLGQENILELKAVEVAREFRNSGIGDRLLSHLFSDQELDKKIIYLTAYSWIWDLAHSRLSILSYRQMLIRLYRKSGFIEVQTNEPNICMKPENIFMVRVGSNVSQKIKEEFKWLRFGISKEDMAAV